jgi:hypothetical protein
MGYYTRILGTNNPNIHLNEIVEELTSKGLTAKFFLDEKDTPDSWTVVSVVNSDNEDIMQIERNPVVDGELGKEELEEFREEIKSYKPISAAKWLDSFFDKVKVIYAFQLLYAAMDDKNFPIVGEVREIILNKTGGITQADNEGFSNEDGYHILWQFSDNVTGEWSCAVKNFFGQWVNFKMDLGDLKQREEFKSGKVPKLAVKL